VLQLDLDLADWFTPSVCLDEAVIDGNLEICLTRMNWEASALDYGLEDRVQLAPQVLACQRLERRCCPRVLDRAYRS
jgi:hypothetical protein